MKKLFLLLVVLLCVSFLSYSQEDTLKKSEIYKIWINSIDGSEIKGIIYQTNDSSLLISNTLKFTDHTRGFSEPINICYNNIKVIKIRSGKKIKKGVIIGSATGFVLGGLMGYAGQARRSSSEEVMTQAFAAGAFFGVCGALVGGVAGSFRITIPIDGSFKKFSENKNRLKEYSYIH